MLTIQSSADMALALDSLIDPSLKNLLMLRRDQLAEHIDYDLGALAHFIVAEPGDAIAEIEAAANYPLISEPVPEYVVDHGDWFEAVTVLSDDGFGIVLLVPDRDGIDTTLLNLLRDLADNGTDDQPGASLA